MDMKYALVDGDKTEATKGAAGICPSCGAELVAKCGEVRINHWAHKGNRMCDPWWENETEWHRQWKANFPADWQEVVHFSESDEKHIADVKTSEDWVLEFQHSFLKPEERRGREAFYGSKLIWIVDGLRRKRDKRQFAQLLNQGRVLNKAPVILRISSLDQCRLATEWLESAAHVFLDFGELDGNGSPVLWQFVPKGAKGEYYVQRVSASALIRLHLDGNFDQKFTEYMRAVHNFLSGRARDNTSSLKDAYTRHNQRRWLRNPRGFPRM